MRTERVNQKAYASPAVLITQGSVSANQVEQGDRNRLIWELESLYRQM